MKKFITKTYNIPSQQSNFFTKINVHIIQCDAEIQKDDKITAKEDVDDLIHKGEFENLKGLLYFTDEYEKNGL